MNLIQRLFEKHKLARRFMLGWSMWLITVVVLRATEADVLMGLSPAGATFLGAVVGILTTAIGFYVKSREREDQRDGSR